MTDKTGGPAFPGLDYIDYKGKKNPEGMTLRDYFAAKAMQGMMADGRTNEDYVASLAYYYADVMLKAREK